MILLKKYRDLIWLAVIILLILFWFKGCFKRDGEGTTRIDTLVKIDTFLVPVQGEKIHVPIETVVYYPKPVETIKEVSVFVEVDTAAILKDYYSSKIYSEAYETPYGEINVDDTISQNAIKGRGFRYNLEVPVVTKQVTITKQEPKRNVAYIGAGIWGNQSSLLFGTEVNLSLKNKQDKIFSVKAMLARDGNPVYGFGVAVPIRLKKR